MPKHRPIAEQVGQLDLTDERCGLNPTKPARTFQQDRQMQVVYKELKKHGSLGRTRFELAKDLGMHDNTVGPRLSDLRRHSMIRKSESERNGAIVWVAR